MAANRRAAEPLGCNDARLRMQRGGRGQIWHAAHAVAEARHRRWVEAHVGHSSRHLRMAKVPHQHVHPPRHKASLSM